jgi:hypothetical protein
VRPNSFAASGAIAVALAVAHLAIDGARSPEEGRCMPNEDTERWCPLRARAEDRQRIAADVAEIPAIQQKALAENASLKVADRVAHQYQIAGGKVVLRIAESLP